MKEGNLNPQKARFDRRLIGAASHYLRFLRRKYYETFAFPVLRQLLNRQATRTRINERYLRKSWAGRISFRNKYVRLYKTGIHPVETGSWQVKFGGRRVLIPLRQDTAWLDWDLALSICGHDTEVKRYYENILTKGEAPDVFLDIGANYGTHSLLMLIHGVRAISFEPNKTCRSEFLEMCKLNGVSGQMEPLALGSEQGKAKIWYPSRDTWFGSTNPKILADFDDMESDDVEQTTLDLYMKDKDFNSVLIKIDAEGSEVAILHGACKTLERFRPNIIFESRIADGKRDQLFDFFTNIGYWVQHLTPDGTFVRAPMMRHVFLTERQDNFIAIYGA